MSTREAAGAVETASPLDTEELRTRDSRIIHPWQNLQTIDRSENHALVRAEGIYVYDLEGGSTRLEAFHAGLRRDGITRGFEGRLETWSYDPLDETARVAEIVRERQGLRQILVQAQHARYGTRDLRDLETVRQARAEVIAFMGDENLGLVLQAAEGGGMDDPVAVALEGAAGRAFGLRIKAAAGLVGPGREWRERIRLSRKRHGGLT